MKSINLKIIKPLVVTLVTMLLIVLYCNPLYANNDELNKRASRLERRADKQFVRGAHMDAFINYEKAVNSLTNHSKQKIEFSCKLARLYTLCQQHTNAIKYYDYVLNNSYRKLSPNDVCNYIDGLRRLGESQRAEEVCRLYAFEDSYNANQRYINMLQSLSNQRHYYGVGEDEYTLERLSFNTNESEYYVGSYNNKPYYIVSNSYMKDPNKIYYHQNRYFTDSVDFKLLFPFIPVDLQEGPMTFSNNNNMIIATVNQYNGMDKIELQNDTVSIYSTKLSISYFNKKNNRWTKFAPLFPDKDEYSSAYPMFINDDQSILFCSNRSGGYGGMDIYISHKDDNNQWSKPINLGPFINTEANEISPAIYQKSLVFSSNGHVGHGGYDVYKIGFQNNEVLEGSLYHYPYPINTSYNDFGLTHHIDNTYLISDREHGAFDDIYIVNEIQTTMSSFDIKRTALQTKNSIIGLEPIIDGYNNNQSMLDQDVDGNSKVYIIPKEGEILLSLYFEFDSYQLTDEMIALLVSMMDSASLNNIEEVLVAGYADELGGDRYNDNLSTQRAMEVSAYLKHSDKIARIKEEGRGKLYLNNSNDIYITTDLEQLSINKQLPLYNKIMMYHKARRVDIIVTKVKR